MACRKIEIAISRYTTNSIVFSEETVFVQEAIEDVRCALKEVAILQSQNVELIFQKCYLSFGKILGFRESTTGAGMDVQGGLLRAVYEAGCNDVAVLLPRSFKLLRLELEFAK